MGSQARSHKLLVLEDGVVQGMASSSVFALEFPMLNPVKAAQTAVAAGGCSACAARQRRAALLQALQSAKAGIAAMPAEKKLRLKELLDAERVRLVYQSGGKSVTLTF